MVRSWCSSLVGALVYSFHLRYICLILFTLFPQPWTLIIIVSWHIAKCRQFFCLLCNWSHFCGRHAAAEIKSVWRSNEILPRNRAPRHGVLTTDLLEFLHGVGGCLYNNAYCTPLKITIIEKSCWRDENVGPRIACDFMRMVNNLCHT